MLRRHLDRPASRGRAIPTPRSGSSARSPGRQSRRRQLDDPETSWLIIVLNPSYLSSSWLDGGAAMCAHVRRASRGLTTRACCFSGGAGVSGRMPQRRQTSTGIDLRRPAPGARIHADAHAPRARPVRGRVLMQRLSDLPTRSPLLNARSGEASVRSRGSCGCGSRVCAPTPGAWPVRELAVVYARPCW